MASQRHATFCVTVRTVASRSRIPTWPVVTGAIAGGAIAIAAGPWLTALLFNESARDPVVYGVVGSVLLGVALVATGVPAFAAAKLDPNVTLRAD